MYKREFAVSNPSPYERSDYVEVDLKTLGFPPELDEHSLILSRLYDGKAEQIPFQIDYILGKKSDRRVITFLSNQTPPGLDDYTKISARYLLEEGKPGVLFESKKNQWVGHYYEIPKKDESKDGFNWEWHENRSINGVKLYNGNIEFYLSLVPHSFSGVNFTGALTYLHLKKASDESGSGEMLANDYQYPFKRWGQITQLAFFPLPWRTEWFQKVSMLDKRYDLIYSNSGPIRGIVTLKSESFDINFVGSPYFTSPVKMIKGNLYRIIYVYPGTSFYIEVIFVQTEDGVSLSFRPYYSSFLNFPNAVSSQLLKNVDYTELGGSYVGNPSFFALWKYFSRGARCFSFASNIRIRSLELSSGEIQWRLPNSHHNKCVHYFMYDNDPAPWKSPLHSIGHDGWYEKIYKPLEVIPLSNIYPTHFPYQKKKEVM